MTRDLLTNPVVATPTDHALCPVQPSNSTQNATRPMSTASVMQDALAGSLPVWDLLPATPFIRRVK